MSRPLAHISHRKVVVLGRDERCAVPDGSSLIARGGVVVGKWADRVVRPMTQQHPDLAAEQDFIEHAYRCLEISRDAAWRMRNLHEGTLGGTFQARYERDVFDEAVVNRLTQLDLGNAALVFGRIDRMAETPEGLETFHIGRLAIADEESEPVVVDWRAPVAEPFYRATGR